MTLIRPNELAQALVRHGANAREALAKVLGVPAGDIRLKEGARSGPLITANTRPTTVPNNPSPNTAVAGTKLRPVAPGSPSGDT
jgi:hypothetical protein